MSDLFSSLLIFTPIKTRWSCDFGTIFQALTEVWWSLAGTTTLDRE
jgi:hypothetical protein